VRGLTFGATVAAALVAFAVPANAAIPEEMRPLGYFSFQRGCAPDDIECIVRDVWPDDLEDRAWGIVQGKNRKCNWGESNANPNAIGPQKEVGLFQIHPTHFRGKRGFVTKLGYTRDDLFDPRINAEMALYLYENSRSGWKNWVCDVGKTRKGP
jgi:hypothetical protein